MKKQLLKVLIFIACLYNFIESMEQDSDYQLHGATEIQLSADDIKYNCHCYVKENVRAQDFHLDKLQKKLAIIIQQLPKSFEFFFYQNPSISKLFPKYPLFKANIKIFISLEPKLRVFALHTPDYVAKEILNEEESEQLNKFRVELDFILITLAKDLTNEMFEHINIPEQGPAIDLDFELSVKKLQFISESCSQTA